MKAQRIDVMMKWLVTLAPVLVLLPRVRIGAGTDDLCRQLGATDIVLSGSSQRETGSRGSLCM